MITLPSCNPMPSNSCLSLVFTALSSVHHVYTIFQMFFNIYMLNKNCLVRRRIGADGRADPESLVKTPPGKAGDNNPEIREKACLLSHTLVLLTTMNAIKQMRFHFSCACILNLK